MLLLNFAHPLTDAQLARIRELAGRDLERIIVVPTHFDHARPFTEQVRELLATLPLTAEQWQTTPLLINPPSLAPIVAALLAEVHGRSGYFPTIVRLRPITGTVPPQFEVAELLNLQEIRDAARIMRAPQLELGWAKLTPTTQAFLDRCSAIHRWRSDVSDRVAVFQFDSLAEIFDAPHGVFFNLDGAPQDAIEVAQELT